MLQIELGDKVKDTITTFTGIAMAKLTYYNGCVRFEILPDKLHEGKPIESIWIDIQQLKVVKKAKKKETKKGGGTMPSPPKLSTP